MADQLSRHYGNGEKGADCRALRRLWCCELGCSGHFCASCCYYGVRSVPRGSRGDVTRVVPPVCRACGLEGARPARQSRVEQLFLRPHNPQTRSSTPVQTSHTRTAPQGRPACPAHRPSSRCPPAYQPSKSDLAPWHRPHRAPPSSRQCCSAGHRRARRAGLKRALPLRALSSNAWPRAPDGEERSGSPLSTIVGDSRLRQRQSTVRRSSPDVLSPLHHADLARLGKNL